VLQTCGTSEQPVHEDVARMSAVVHMVNAASVQSALEARETHRLNAGELPIQLRLPCVNTRTKPPAVEVDSRLDQKLS
jgi:hypothetical protein